MFFSPAEASMIPKVVPRKQLLAANGIFTLTLNAAFAIGFALLGPLVVKIAGAETLILVVAITVLHRRGLLLHAALGAAAPQRDADGRGLDDRGEAVGSVFAQLREGLDYIRGHREIRWSLFYLGDHRLARRRPGRPRARLRGEDARPQARRTSSSSSCRSGSAS